MGTKSTSQTKYLSGDYWIENYGKKEGLPENVVIDITQDRKGYIWINTPYSLIRFNGYDFKVFDPRKQYPDLYIHFSPGLMEDSQGILWMSTFTKGLFSFDPSISKFRQYSSEDSAKSITGNSITGIIEDQHNILWVATGSGLNRITGKGDALTIKKYFFGYPEKLLALLDEKLQEKKAVTGFNKVGDREQKSVIFNPKATTRYLVVCMGERDSDYGWIEDEKGVKIWSMDTRALLPAGGAQKNIWQLDIVTLKPGKNKIVYQTDENHSWNNWNEEPPDRAELWGLQLFEFPQAMTDTIQGLINTIEDENFDSYGFNISTIIEDSKNNIWTLAGGGLEKLELPSKTNGKIVSEKIKLVENFIPGFLLELDADRLIIQGTFLVNNQPASTGSVIYNHRNKSFEIRKSDQLLLPTANSKAFIRDRYHHYWMGTFDNIGSGLYVSEDDSEFPVFKPVDITASHSKQAGKQGYEQIWSLYEDRSGYLWVASRQNGLYKIKTRRAPVNFTALQVSGTKINITPDGIGEDAAGNLWFSATEYGLFKYNRQSKAINHFAMRNNKPGPTYFFSTLQNDMVISHVKNQGILDIETSAVRPPGFQVPDSLRLILQDNAGNYWARNKDINAGGLYIFNGVQFQQVTFDSLFADQTYFRNFHVGYNGNVWISPNFDGVHHYKLNKETRKLSFVAKNYLREGTDVFDIYEEENGTVWLGTYADGLLKLNPENKSVRSFTRAEGLPSDLVFKLVPLEGKIWVVTDLGSAFLTIANEHIQLNKELDEYISQKSNGFFHRFGGDRGYGGLIHKTRSGEIVIGVTDGFCLFDPADILIDTIKPILQVTNLIIDKKQLEFDENTRLNLKYFQNDLEIAYIGIHYDQPGMNQYKYLLKGAAEDWTFAGKDRIARYANLAPGNYEFYLQASNAEGVWSQPRRMFSFTIFPPWWKTWWAYALYLILGIALVWLFIRYRSHQLKKENIILEEKVSDRTMQLKESLENLRSTQAQLIQSEKMASLGELTAGIAHEIQNPLNFVNNFAEVNSELIAEMKQEIEAGNLEEVKTIANNVNENEQKIIFHGRRADAIVKGMLQHSRNSSGVKEPTDINALADEYFRLAYHGLRAKDKSFNATMKTDFDGSIRTVDIIPQDIGRVILNLITNAFYAVMQKKESLANNTGENKYEPTVTVSTKKAGDKVSIIVNDNGNGIPIHVLDKIFQPFFTTKPTGEGTGLGLSMSYDIVTKGHGGDLRAGTNTDGGAQFIIILPVYNKN